MSNNDFYKSNPSNLYKYKGTYYNKGEQVSLMTGSLHELQGNSLNGPTKYSKSKNIINNSLQNTCIDETDKESSSDVMEIIFDGKMDENMIQKSTDQTTINSYNEFIGKKEINFKKNKIDMYNTKKKNVNNNENIENIDDNKDADSIISDIPKKPINPINNYKYSIKN